MRSFLEIKKHYNFTAEDEKRLLGLSPVMVDNVDKVVNSVHDWIIQTDVALKLFKNDTIMNHIMNQVRKWFISLFSGKYDSAFYDYLIRIGQKHEKAGVDPHFISRAMNIVRNKCIDILSKEIENSEQRAGFLISLEKILDITLDIINASYIEEEIKVYSPAYRLKSRIVGYGEIFSQFLNMALVLGLIIVTLAVVYLCGRDIYEIFVGKLEQTIVTALGSVLILWVMLELINTEIVHLKGGKFKISVFVGVALVTTIREVMISTLKHDSIEFIGALVASVLVIGIIYWLVKRTEEEKR
uniref:Heme-binding sensor globin domain-containing protein n=1 Tax=Thermodesulfovibrio aggregans TaxID=86166 RepID=A0A7C4AKA0_9BACT